MKENSLSDFDLADTGVPNVVPVDVFIHSSPHSGSTWLGYVLGSSSESTFVGELFRAWSDYDRVPCTICASRGLEECVLLHGIERTEPREVFQLIAGRSKKRIIVDNSKSIEWTKTFVDRKDRNLHVVHVVKDPRSRWASLRRRQPDRAIMEDCLATWCAENQKIRDFVAQFEIPATVVAYDLIAANQEKEISSIFASFGSRFEPSCLRYWEVDHHGFAANGASSALIQHRQLIAPPKHFSTADDKFYGNMFGRNFVDERWRIELPKAEMQAIENNIEVASILDRLGYHLTSGGMKRNHLP